MLVPTVIGYFSRTAIRQLQFKKIQRCNLRDINSRCISLLSRVYRRKGVINNPHQINETNNAEELLKNAVTGISDVRDETSVWSSPAYPKCEVKERDQSLKRIQPNCDPQDTCIVLFPGQGSQFVGMGKALAQFSEAKHICDLASNFLGYDILELCLNGPEEKLSRTEFSQVCVFVLSYAAAEILNIVQPGAVEKCIGTAGFSVGEITALAFSEAISFSEALRLVKVRADAMQEACDAAPGGMMTVFYGPDSRLEYACLCAKKWCAERGIENPECAIANYLFPHCKVIAGSIEALKFIEQNASQFKLKRLKRIPVSGAFHTSFMKAAADPFKRTLKEINIRYPKIPVYSNVNGNAYKNGRQIRELLPKQIYKPVKWEQTLHVLYERASGENFPYTYECGPGSNLKSCLKMVNARAWNYCSNIKV